MKKEQLKSRIKELEKQENSNFLSDMKTVDLLLSKYGVVDISSDFYIRNFDCEMHTKEITHTITLSLNQ